MRNPTQTVSRRVNTAPAPGDTTWNFPRTPLSPATARTPAQQKGRLGDRLRRREGWGARGPCPNVMPHPATAGRIADRLQNRLYLLCRRFQDVAECHVDRVAHLALNAQSPGAQ